MFGKKGKNHPMFGKKGKNHPMFGKKGKNHPMFGKHLTEETIKKISKSLLGVNNPMFGKHHSKESREKISKALKGKRCGEDNPAFGKRCYWTGVTGKNHPCYIDGKCYERANARDRNLPKLEHFLGNKYNDKYKMVAHHFNEKTIIYIPEYIHQKNSHNLKTGKGMMKINMLALFFLLKGF